MPTRAQYAARVEQEFANQGIIPAPGSITRIVQNLMSGTRTWQKVQADIAWVRRYLTNNPDEATDPGGHRLASSPNAGQDEQDGTTDSFDYLTATKNLYPYFPTELINVFADSWKKYGPGQERLAVAEVRQHHNYENYFPGNRRSDGTVRYNELEYLGTVEEFRDIFVDYGLPRDTFNTRIPDLIRGDVTTDLLRRRMQDTYSQIVSNTEAVREEYARQHGITNLSIRAIFASALDPSHDPTVFEQELRRAQIGGEARQAGFTLPLTEINQLAEFGFDQQAAREFYTSARRLLPTLASLVDRHNDPDDTFDLNELTDAIVFQDPEQERRLARLFSSEASLYNARPLFSEREGMFPGLSER